MRTPERGSGIVGTEERSPSGSTNPKCATIRRSSRTESRLNGPSGPLPSPTFAAEDPSTSAGHLIDERRARTGARRPKEAPATRRRPFSPFHERKIGATKQIRRSKIQHPHSKEETAASSVNLQAVATAVLPEEGICEKRRHLVSAGFVTPAAPGIPM